MTQALYAHMNDKTIKKNLKHHYKAENKRVKVREHPTK
jgi:hypothetical protein